MHLFNLSSSIELKRRPGKRIKTDKNKSTGIIITLPNYKTSERPETKNADTQNTMREIVFSRQSKRNH